MAQARQPKEPAPPSGLPPLDPIRPQPVAPYLKEAIEEPFHDTEEAEATLKQLSKVVSEFMVKYPSHTQRLPAGRPGEHALIAFVRQMAASMAGKQEELETLNSEVTEAALEKERFLANMSHEVRTPMNGIFGMVNLLLEMDLDSVQREYLETIQTSSESLLNILDDMLDYAKLNARQMPLKPRKFELSKLIHDVLLVYKPTADAKNIELSGTICESIPDEFIADDLRLKQVISNFISNAIKFTEHGSASITVRQFKRSEGSQLFFEISDTGIGISPESGKNLFRPFCQLDSEPEKRYEGTGLGLVISKNLIELMGGCVWFESECGVGTTFYFTVDYELPEKEKTGPISPNLVSRSKLERHRASPMKDKEKLRVLLVEDNKMNQKVEALTLQQLGCEVTVANNGKEAVAFAQGPVHFGLICMDVNMPIMNGLEATKAIRALDHPNTDTYILAMTGMAFDEDIERCRNVGMDDVITKPFELNELRERVDEIKNASNSDVTLSS